MQQHDGRQARIALPQIDRIQDRAGDRDHLTPRWISPLKDKNGCLSQQCESDWHRDQHD
jgi:hypothetical protein